VAYAKGTDVSIDKSIADVKALLRSHGATRIGTVEDDQENMVVFELCGYSIRIKIVVPRRDDLRYTTAGRYRDAASITRAVAAEQRRRWRVMFVYLKAKLTAIEEEITTVEEEFLSGIVMPGGATVGDVTIPRLGEVAAGRERISLAPASTVIALSDGARR
jgi:hypothetical protein